ncbi:hypothetical protein U1Q18_030473, partial [Sarracenia purpurea var. burkii]
MEPICGNLEDNLDNEIRLVPSSEIWPHKSKIFSKKAAKLETKTKNRNIGRMKLIKEKKVTEMKKRRNTIKGHNK